jgi:hypothetical protein
MMPPARWLWLAPALPVAIVPAGVLPAGVLLVVWLLTVLR